MTRISHILHVNEACHTLRRTIHECVMSHIHKSCHVSMSHVTYEWVTSHTSKVPTHEWVMLHMNESNHVRMGQSFFECQNYFTHFESTHSWMNPVTYEWFMSHTTGLVIWMPESFHTPRRDHDGAPSYLRTLVRAHRPHYQAPELCHVRISTTYSRHTKWLIHTWHNSYIHDMPTKARLCTPTTLSGTWHACVSLLVWDILNIYYCIY